MIYFQGTYSQKGNNEFKNITFKSFYAFPSLLLQYLRVHEQWVDVVNCQRVRRKQKVTRCEKKEIPYNSFQSLLYHKMNYTHSSFLKGLLTMCSPTLSLSTTSGTSGTRGDVKGRKKHEPSPGTLKKTGYRIGCDSKFFFFF